MGFLSADLVMTSSGVHGRGLLVESKGTHSGLSGCFRYAKRLWMWGAQGR